MKRRRTQIAVAISALALLALGAAAVGLDQTSKAATATTRLADATLIVEVNATDGDAGLQVFLDGEPWRSMTISSPDGRRMLAINNQGRLKNFGLTELFSESSEPPFDVFPLEKFKELFPEGKYTFAGTTVDGETLVGTATLTHNIPDGPKIASPADGATVPRDDVVLKWKPVTTPGIEIVGYRAIVSGPHEFSVELPAGVNSVIVPPEFLRSGTKYALEVQAIEVGGNQTLTQTAFRVK